VLIVVVGVVGDICVWEEADGVEDVAWGISTCGSGLGAGGV